MFTETITVNDNQLLIVNVEEGLSKPYKDSNGTIYVKNGADKRKVTSNDEIARLLQAGKSLYADEMLIKGSSTKDIDIKQFNLFLFKKYKKTLDELQAENLTIDQILENLNLAKDGAFLLTGLLSFSTKRHFYCPQFSIQCVSVDGTIIGNTFYDNENTIEGTISEVFNGALGFIGRNMKKIPQTDGFNSPTKWEIPHEVFEELLVNALVHRDYLISSTVKVFVFSDRVEIVSPGRLPNSLTVENIKNGISILRNPILLSTVQHILPYKGLGTGIVRSYALYPNITMENKPDENQFKVIIQRSQVATLKTDENVPENTTKYVKNIENVPENNTENNTENGNVTENNTEKLSKSQKAIIDEIRKNPHITSETLSDVVGITADNVRVNISKLKAKGIIQRIGPDKGGYWKILKK